MGMGSPCPNISFIILSVSSVMKMQSSPPIGSVWLKKAECFTGLKSSTSYCKSNSGSDQ